MNMWERTGAIEPSALADARIQLHWAAQSVAGVGRTLHACRADDSHTTLTWSARLDALVQDPFDGVTSGLRPRDLTLIAIGDSASKLPLQGRTLDDAYAFFESRFATTFKRPAIELPDHPVAHGATFDANGEHLAELARYYNDAARVLSVVARSDSRASVVRCWPHHFDIATLITLSGHDEEARTIGIGLSPGDGTSLEPYYYVTPWPYPDASRLGALRVGRWNTAGWTGAVLAASSFAHVDRQEERVRAFLDEAIALCRAALR
jgi:hypothetical protein